MADFGPALTDDQWNRIRQIVHDEALRARVAASFLPLYGPLPGDATTVPMDLLSQPRTRRPRNLGGQRLRRAPPSDRGVNVFVKNHMLADPELAAASIMFKRAANIIARVEDAIIFRGRHAPLPLIRPLLFQAPPSCRRSLRSPGRTTTVSWTASGTSTN